MPDDDLPDEPGWYWIEHKGEHKPAWWADDMGHWRLGKSQASPWISPEYATMLSELPGPGAADRLDRYQGFLEMVRDGAFESASELQDAARRTLRESGGEDE